MLPEWELINRTEHKHETQENSDNLKEQIKSKDHGGHNSSKIGKVDISKIFLSSHMAKPKAIFNRGRLKISKELCDSNPS